MILSDEQLVREYENMTRQLIAERDEARAWARKLKRERDELEARDHWKGWYESLVAHHESAIAQRDELEAASKQALLALEAWPTSPVPHIVQRTFKRIQEALA